MAVAAIKYQKNKQQLRERAERAVEYLQQQEGPADGLNVNRLSSNFLDDDELDHTGPPRPAAPKLKPKFTQVLSVGSVKSAGRFTGLLSDVRQAALVTQVEEELRSSMAPPGTDPVEQEAHAHATAKLRDFLEKSMSGTLRYQPQVRAMYASLRTQSFVAVLIMLNFVANVVEKELDPQGTQAPRVWRAMEHSFNAIFLVELLVNMYSYWFWQFWISKWNQFDFVVVCVGCVSFAITLDGPLKLLRTLRAFRVFRLFKRIESLNKIVLMISTAVPGVASAFLVMLLMISIYAMVAVEFFSTFGTAPPQEVAASGSSLLAPPSAPGTPVASLADEASYTCAYSNINGGVVDAESARGLCFGAEYFGTFTRAWFTLFQVLTGESWSEVIARPVLFGWKDYDPLSSFLSALFFVSFVLINTFILFNVFVAVLLDKMVQPDPMPDIFELAGKASEEAGGAEGEGGGGAPHKSEHADKHTDRHTDTHHSQQKHEPKSSGKQMVAQMMEQLNEQMKQQQALSDRVDFVLRSLERLERHMNVPRTPSPEPPPSGPEPGRLKTAKSTARMSGMQRADSRPTLVQGQRSISVTKANRSFKSAKVAAEGGEGGDTQ